MKKKILSLALAILLLTALVPAANEPVLALSYGTNGKFVLPIDPPALGSIPISNREDLQKIGTDKSFPLNGKYHLTADIDLSDGAWVPIGNYSTSLFGTSPFKGIFDGQGYVIRGLTIIGDNLRAGLFACASSDAVIKNVGLEDINISINGSSQTSAGAICADGGNISNCYSTGSISVSAMGAYAGHRAFAGGICGMNGSVENSYNSCSVSADCTYLAYAGGISGYNSSISSCYNTGIISASGGSPVYAGGICGYSNAISDCYNTGSISASSRGENSYAGGISGVNIKDGSISNCYNTGVVYGSSPSSKVSYVGGLCGYSQDGAVIRSSYWNIDSRVEDGLGYGIGQATALTSEQMKQQSSYSGWDFTTVWGFKPGVNDGYPVLRAFYEFPSAWAEAAVYEAIEKDILPASLQNNYTKPCTRAEFCALAVALIEQATGKEITERATFKDTDDINVRKIGGMEIVYGVGDDNFNPDGNISRQEAAIILERLARKGLDKQLPEGEANFSDLHLILISNKNYPNNPIPPGNAHNAGRIIF